MKKKYDSLKIRNFNVGFTIYKTLFVRIMFVKSEQNKWLLNDLDEYTVYDFMKSKNWRHLAMYQQFYKSFRKMSIFSILQNSRVSI